MSVEKVYRFFDYHKCYAHYTKHIMKIRQAKIHGEVIVAKPVLLLTIIDGIEIGEILANEIMLTDWLESRYVMLMHKNMRNSQFEKPTDISNPFWHLQSDGFWHMRFLEEMHKGITPSKRWLKENISFAYFDDDLWLLLQNKAWRMKLRDYIVEHKLTDGHWFGKIAEEGLGAVAVLILAA